MVMTMALCLLDRNSRAGKRRQAVCRVGEEFWFAEVGGLNAPTAGSVPEVSLSHL